MKQRGFTLIELVVVVAIVGILASAALPLARWGVKRNKEYVLQQNLRIMRNAIDRYHDAAQAGLIEVPEGTSGYPESLEALVEGVPLLGQMPPVMPGVSDEYGASGPGLTGGIGTQLQAGDVGQGIGAAGAASEGAGPVGSAQPGQSIRQSFGQQGVRLGANGGTQTASPLPSTGMRIVVDFGQQQGDAGARVGGLSQLARLGQQGTVGQLDTQANEPLIGPDGKPVLVMFLRRIPVDPMTGKAEWGVRCYGEPPADRLWCGRDVFDIYSKAFSDAIDGTKYRDW